MRAQGRKWLCLVHKLIRPAVNLYTRWTFVCVFMDIYTCLGSTLAFKILDIFIEGIGLVLVPSHLKHSFLKLILTYNLSSTHRQGRLKNLYFYKFITFQIYE